MSRIRIPGLVMASALVMLGVAAPVDAAFPGRNGKLVYESRGALVVSDADPNTNDAVTIVTASKNPDAPKWSPDGTKIVMSQADQSDPSNNHIWVVNANGTNPVQLTFGGLDDGRASWSPDGAQIVFARYNASEMRQRIMRINADGTGTPRSLTAPAADDVYDYRPVWSPDGRRIAFAAFEGGSSRIDIMDADGTHRIPFATGTTDINYPAWSPDSTRIAYEVGTASGTKIVVKRLSGGGPVNIVPDGATPDWSPDGKWIIYRRYVAGDADIWKRRSDGTGQQVLVADGDSIESDDSFQGEASWQPKCDVKGNANANVLVGTSKAELICGFGGNDVIDGKGGNDIVFGGGGRDRVTGGNGNDVLVGGDGNDTLKGLAGADRLLGGKGNDPLNGGKGKDVCLQGPGSGSKTACES